MGVYYTTKCGHCNIKWEFLNMRGNTKLGPPIVKCSSCFKMNKTKYKLYRDMSIFEKTVWYVQCLFSIGFGLIMLIGGLFLLFDMIFYGGHISGIIEESDWLGWVFSIGLILIGSRNSSEIFHLNSHRKDLEHFFDSNGGFLWSNQTYG